MNAKKLLGEISKSKRFLPANLENVEVVISKNNGGITFYFIEEGGILHKFTIKEGDVNEF